MLPQWLGRILAGKLGWKAVTAAAVLALLVIGVNLNWITEAQFDHYTKLAEALGMVGLRDAFSKIRGA